MKTLVIGDQHFRFELAYAHAFKDGRKAEWEAVKEQLHESAKNCDAVVLMGDCFNSRHNHSSVIREFIDFLKGFGDKEIHILAGNHERYGQATALDFLDRIKHPNWFVYLEPRTAVIAGYTAMMIPYMTPALLGVETKEQAQDKLLNLPSADLCFLHHVIGGTKGSEFFNEIVLDKNILSKKYGMTFGGHIHSPERLSNNVIVTGNIFCQDLGEHDKKAWIWDDVTNTTLEIPLPTRGIYKMVWEAQDNKGAIPGYSIVKCYVTNRETNLDDVKKFLKLFDASIIVEQYENERRKTHFESGVLDLSIDSLLKMYAEARGVSHEDLKQGFELIKN